MEQFLEEYNIPLVSAGVCLMVGFILSIFGAKLLKTGSGISGLVLGGFGGWAVALRYIDDPTYVLVCVGVGALLGCLITWLLFRVWMGISCMAILAVAVPLSVMAVQNKSIDLTEGQSVQGSGGVSKSTEPRRPAPSAADWVMSQSLQAGEDSGGVSAAIFKATGEEAKEKVKETASWVKTFALGRWEQLTEVEKTKLSMASAIGGVFGLLIGLVLPKIAAAIQSSIIGAILILIGGYNLLVIYDPTRAAQLTQTPSRVFITLCVLAGLAVLFQWTFLKKKTDS